MGVGIWQFLIDSNRESGYQSCQNSSLLILMSLFAQYGYLLISHIYPVTHDMQADNMSGQAPIL